MSVFQLDVYLRTDGNYISISNLAYEYRSCSARRTPAAIPFTL